MPNIIRTGMVGGSGGANFEYIVSQLEPSNPKPGLIWVQADPQKIKIDKVVMTHSTILYDKEPNTLYVMVSDEPVSSNSYNSYSFTFFDTKKSKIELKIGGLRCYDQNGKIARISMFFIWNGTMWINYYNEIFLFKNGNQYLNDTGGWAKRYEKPNDGATMNFKIENNMMKLSCDVKSGGSNVSGAQLVSTDRKIQLDIFSKLHIACPEIQPGIILQLLLLTDKTSHMSVAGTSFDNNNNTTTMINTSRYINISSIRDSYYIGVYMTDNKSKFASYATVSKIWLSIT